MESELRQKLDALKIDRDEPVRAPGTGLRILVALGLLVVAAAAAWWLLRPRSIEVKTAIVEELSQRPGGPSAVLNASGYVTARRQATVSSKITGKVVEVLVEEGMKVEKDQVLARLDASQTRQALALSQALLAASQRASVETEARIREAMLRQKRVRTLVGQGISTTADADAVDAEVDALQARLATQHEQAHAAEREVDMARQNLDDTIIRAPFAGVAISKNAQPGEMISPNSAGGGFTRTGISTIVDMSSLEIEVDVNEAYIQRVQPGQAVTATLDAYRDWPIPGHVITTIPAADRQKATVTVRIGFDALDPRILPDMGVKVAFLADASSTGASTQRVVRVARSAVRGSQGAEFVFVVGNGDRLERRGVSLGAGADDPAEVVAGLRAGERIVVEGPADIAAGTRVTERHE